VVETPYWGMEHQSCIAYGNKYKQNKYGFDFILVHESGHEWWGNLVSASDHADLWIHEAFCTYAELIYVERTLGREMAKKYAAEMSAKIKNNSIIVGPGDVAYNDWKDADMYYKGALILNTIRQLLKNDGAWFKIIKDFTTNTTPISTTTAIAIITSRINELYQKNETKLEPKILAKIFQQYLFTQNIPILELKQVKFDKYKERWVARFTNVRKGFYLPISCLAPNDGVKTINIKADWTYLGYYGAPQTQDLLLERKFINSHK
jgi:aminopeptidase N